MKIGERKLRNRMKIGGLQNLLYWWFLVLGFGLW